MPSLSKGPWQSRAVLGTLLLVLNSVLALPASIQEPPSLSLLQPSNLTAPKPPKKAVCDRALGKLEFSDCDEAIKLWPRDPRGQPVVRNFYTDPNDMSTTIPNQLVPFETSYGRISALCTGLRVILILVQVIVPLRSCSRRISTTCRMTRQAGSTS